MGEGSDVSDALEVLSRYETLIDDFAAFRAACRRPLPRTVRINPIKADPEHVCNAFREAGIGTERRLADPCVLAVESEDPGNTWPYVHGWVHGQETVSALPARVLDPDPGDHILDTCAAPGSKATQLAGAMEDRGLLIANDSSLGRLAALRSNADRLGVTCAAVTNRDARSMDLDPLDGTVDGALVDVPCSCEGTVRKNPDVLEDWSEAHVTSIATVQRAILARAVALTKPGGTVVYSTCTFAPEENEAVLDAVVDGGSCQIVEFDIPLPHTEGIGAWRGTEYDRSVARAKRIYPHHADTGGFFCAKLEVTK